MLTFPSGIALVGFVRLFQLPDVHWASTVWAAYVFVFASEFVVRIWLSEDRIAYLRTRKSYLLIIPFPMLIGFRTPEFELHPMLIALFNSRPMLPGGIVPVACTGAMLAYWVLVFFVNAEKTLMAR